jgi:hypothetical protein
MKFENKIIEWELQILLRFSPEMHWKVVEYKPTFIRQNKTMLSSYRSYSSCIV